MFTLHKAKLSTGERLPTLLYEKTYQPVVLPTRYVVDERRETKQSGTIERDLRVIRWIYTWAQRRQIDLESRLRAGEILTTAEIISFAKYLRARRSEAIVGGLNLKGEEQYLILSPNTFTAYLGVVESYLVWAAKTFIPTVTPVKEIRLAVEQAKEVIKDAFRSVSVGGKSAPRTGLTPEQVAAIREVLKPGSPKNPFKKPVQFRNYSIFELLRETGIRRGELLKIKLNYLPQGIKKTLTVERCPDDFSDPRRNEPQVKTLTREVPLTPRLAKLLWDYAHKYRKKGKHPYLFTSNRDGAALGSGGVNWIFSLLVRECFPELKGRLSPHTLRHTFNDGLVLLADEMGLDEKQIQAIQRYLCGWSEESEMPSHYTRRIVEAKAMELLAHYQQSLWED
jgi:integrase